MENRGLCFTQENALITPDNVRGLSLGALSEQYGTAGLYVRSIDTLEQTGLLENDTVRKAVLLGLALHAHDKRTNGRYADHLLRVMLRVVEEYAIHDPAIVATTPLHDSVEDHARELVYVLTGERVQNVTQARRLAQGALAAYVGDETAHLVMELTNPEVQPGEDSEVLYDDHTRELVARHPKVRVVKLADFTDNAVGNHATVGPLQRKLDRKYFAHYAVHAAGLYLPDSMITGERREAALGLLARGYERAVGRRALYITDAKDPPSLAAYCAADVS